MPSIVTTAILNVRTIRTFRTTCLFPLNLPAATHVVRVRGDGVERDACDIRIPIRGVVERGCRVSDRVADRSHAAVEPRPAAEAADDGYRKGLCDRRTGHGT